MKLEKFNKHKKQKEIIIGAILILIGIIGSISLYRSFAMYEEKQTFDVLKGTVPDFRIGKGDVNFIALTVNGEKTSKVPLKTNAEYKVEVTCDKGATGEWDIEKWRIILSSVTEIPTSCAIDFTYEGESFEYTGNEQIFTAPIEGRYKLEVWGAEGGKWSTSVQGGYGGYAKGEIKLTQGEELHVYVGGKGNGNNTHITQMGGYNGGGSAVINSDGNTRPSSGGGATHIALVTGLLKELEDQKDKILIVAGGGGGTGNNSVQNPGFISGSGGGFKGVDSSTNFVYGKSYGGTQEAGGDYYCPGCDIYSAKGSFGQGATASMVGAGGGGFYGGGASSYISGGGSGYIGNDLLTNKEMWCYKCETSEEINLKTNTTTETSAEAKSNTPKQGHGFAKITYLGNS